MNVRVCNIDVYNNFLVENSHFATFNKDGVLLTDTLGYLDIERLTKDKIDNFLDSLQSYSVSSETTLEGLSRLVWPEQEIVKAKDRDIIYHIKIPLKKGKIYVQREFYCYQIANHWLPIQQEFGFYQLEENALIVFAETDYGPAPDDAPYYSVFLRWAKEQDFKSSPKKESVKFHNYIVTQIIGNWKKDAILPIYKGLLLNTDDNPQLSTYIRNNYKYMDGLPAVRLKLLEQQDELMGYKSKEYWKSKVDSDLYDVFNFLGYTIFKPYGKAEIQELINRYHIKLSDLPGILIFNHLYDGRLFFEKDVILIKIQEDFVKFLKNLKLLIYEVRDEIIQEYRKLNKLEKDAKAFYECKLTQSNREDINAMITKEYNKLKNGLETFPRFRDRLLTKLNNYKSQGHEAYKDVMYGFRGETLVIDFKW